MRYQHRRSPMTKAVVIAAAMAWGIGPNGWPGELPTWAKGPAGAEGGRIAAPEGQEVLPEAPKVPANVPAKEPNRAAAVESPKVGAIPEEFAPEARAKPARSPVKVISPRVGVNLPRVRVELSIDLAEIERLRVSGSLEAAVEKLVAMTTTKDDWLHEVEPGRYRPEREILNERIATLPEAGGRLYRQRVEGLSQKLMGAARAGDRAALQTLCTQLRHGPDGPESLVLAARAALDAEAHDQAARLLAQRLGLSDAQDPQRPRLMVERAVALGLASRVDEATAVASQLASEHPQAGLVVAGRRVNAAQWLGQWLGETAARWGQASDVPPPTQTGLAEAVTDDIVAGSRAAWSERTTPPPVPWNVALPGQAIAAQAHPQGAIPKHDHGEVEDEVGDDWTLRRAQVREGYVVMKSRELWEPPGVMVAEGRMVVRTAQELRAMDPATGRVAWRVATAVERRAPLENSEAANNPSLRETPQRPLRPDRHRHLTEIDPAAVRQVYRGPLHLGHKGFTVAGGLVVVIEDRPLVSADDENNLSSWTVRSERAQDTRRWLAPQLREASRLAAYRLSDGHRVWWVGFPPQAVRGEPDTQGRPPAAPAEEKRPTSPGHDGPPQRDDLTGMTFLAPPRVAGQRVYTLGRQGRHLHVMCLALADGRPLWSRTIQEFPELSGHDEVPPTTETGLAHHDFVPASPITVVGGTVIALTNMGRVAALEADTGVPLWIVDYHLMGLGASPPTPLANPDNPRRQFGRVDAPPRFSPWTLYPPSPVLVANGVAYLLPADSSRLMALRLDTGQSVWSQTVPREGQNYLLGVVDGQLVVAGPDVICRRASTGALVRRVSVATALQPTHDAAHRPGGGQARPQEPAPAEDSPNRDTLVMVPVLTRQAVYLAHRESSPPPSGMLAPAKSVTRPTSRPSVYLVRVALTEQTDGHVRELRLPHDPNSPELEPGGQLCVVNGRLAWATDTQTVALEDGRRQLADLDTAWAVHGDTPAILLERGPLRAWLGDTAGADDDLCLGIELATQRGHMAAAWTAQTQLPHLLYKRLDSLPPAAPPHQRQALMARIVCEATSPTQQAAMQFELARQHAQTGSDQSLREAVAIAIEILSAPPVTFHMADRTARRHRASGVVGAPLNSHEVAHQFVAEWIARHGPDIYTVCEQRVDQHLAAAIAAPDEQIPQAIKALEKLLAVYRHTRYRDRLYLERGRLEWRALQVWLATVDPADRAKPTLIAEIDARLKLIDGDLTTLVENFPQSPWRVSALVATAALSVHPPWQFRPRARAGLRRLEGLPPQTPVLWPGLEPRPLSEALADLRAKVSGRP